MRLLPLSSCSCLCKAGALAVSQTQAFGTVIEFLTRKKALGKDDSSSLPRANIRKKYIRGATLLCFPSHLPCQGFLHTLCGIPSYSRQLTYALRHGILSPKAVDHALCGPFANQRSARLSPARTLWKCPSRFISTSTVSDYSIPLSPELPPL